MNHKTSLVGAASALCAGIALALPQVAVAGVPPQFDHLKCYQVKDSQKQERVDVDLLTYFQDQLEEGCTVLTKAKMYCTAAQKIRVTEDPEPQPVGDDPRLDNLLTLQGQYGLVQGFLCYNVRCPKIEPEEKLLNDQFGERPIEEKRAKMLCAPAVSPDID